MSKINFNNLVGAARNEAAPEVNVAEDVLATLFTTRPAEFVSYKPLAWIASASGAMAAGIAVAAFMFVRHSSGGAMTDLYQAISWAAQ